MSSHPEPGHSNLRERIRTILSEYYHLTDPYGKTIWKGNTYYSESTPPEAFAIMVLLHNFHHYWHDCSLKENQRIDFVIGSIRTVWGETIIDEIITLLLEEEEQSE